MKALEFLILSLAIWFSIVSIYVIAVFCSGVMATIKSGNKSRSVSGPNILWFLPCALFWAAYIVFFL